MINKNIRFLAIIVLATLVLSAVAILVTGITKQSNINETPEGIEEHETLDTEASDIQYKEVVIKTALREVQDLDTVEYIVGNIFDDDDTQYKYYFEGQTIHLEAYGVVGYKFVGWFDKDNNQLTSDIFYTAVCTGDMEFRAVYDCLFTGEHNASKLTNMYISSPEYKGANVRATQEIIEGNILTAFLQGAEVVTYNYDETLEWTLVLGWDEDGAVMGYVHTDLLVKNAESVVHKNKPTNTTNNGGSVVHNIDWQNYLRVELEKSGIPNVSYWYQVALAIAWQESTWNPNVAVDRGYQIDTGLFQIAAHSKAESEALKNPINNVNAFLFSHSFVANIKAGLPVEEVVARHKYSIYCKNSCTNTRSNVNNHGCSIYNSYVDPNVSEDSHGYVNNVRNKWATNHGYNPF